MAIAMGNKTCKKCGRWQPKPFCEYCISKNNKPIILGVRKIKGYSEPGYNEGLGKVIKNKREWLDESKRIGAEPV